MRKFHELFAGRSDVYGTYVLSAAQKITEKGDKRLGKAKTVTNSELTQELYDAHLRGEQSIGVVPIRLDGTVTWFAIDVDDYIKENMHQALAHKIERLNLPLLVFRSKSGGAHLYCFLTEPMEAKVAREYAEKFLTALGLPKKTEIFPKQDAILKKDAGSWINLPYFGSDRPCLGIDGCTPLSLKEFLLLAAEREIHPSDLGFRKDEISEYQVEEVNAPEGHEGAPPCVVKMLSDGIEEGGRDNAITHLAVYYKKAFPEDWQDRVADANERLCTPALPMREVLRIIKSSERKDYQYLCKQSPMVSICDKALCLKREFGVGDGEAVFSNFSIDAIRKVGTEDPYYVVIVDGLPVRLTSAQLLNYKEFERAVFEKLNKVLAYMKPMEWKKVLSEAMIDMEHEEAPEEIGTTGAIRRSFYDWTAQRIFGDSNKERIIDGQPFYDQQGRHILFRGTDFLAHVRRNAGNRYDERIIWLTLADEGAEEVRVDIKGRNLRLWKYPVTEPWFNIKSDGEGF